jgi:hypothetical protein
MAQRSRSTGPAPGTRRDREGRREVWDGKEWVDAGPIPPRRKSGGDVPLEVLPEELEEDLGGA